VLREIEDALGINFKQDVDVEYINLREEPGGKKFRKRGRTLEINLASLGEEQTISLLQLGENQFHEEGRFLRHKEESDTEAIESGYEEEYDEILSYFEGVVSDNYHEIIDKSLHLRGIIDEKGLDKNEIQQKKGQIARRHGEDAIYLSSLVSAGYFDRNSGIWDMYVDMELNEEFDRYNFHSKLSHYVDQELFCVFVENDQDVSSVVQDVRGGLARYQREEPIQEWFDVRGIGNGCAEIIDGVMDDLEERYISLDYERWTDDDDLWVRIYPNSLPPIST